MLFGQPNKGDEHSPVMYPGMFVVGRKNNYFLLKSDARSYEENINEQKSWIVA
jgi:hypothetical protein